MQFPDQIGRPNPTDTMVLTAITALTQASPSANVGARFTGDSPVPPHMLSHASLPSRRLSDRSLFHLPSPFFPNHTLSD